MSCMGEKYIVPGEVVVAKATEYVLRACVLDSEQAASIAGGCAVEVNLVIVFDVRPGC